MTRPMTTHATRLPTDLHRATCELNALNKIAGGVCDDRDAAGRAGECAELATYDVTLLKQCCPDCTAIFISCVRLRFDADLCHCVFPVFCWLRVRSNDPPDANAVAFRAG
jgi:hypothetical protein